MRRRPPTGPSTTCPICPGRAGPAVTDAATTIVTNVVLIAFLAWQHVAVPVVVDGRAFTLLDPALAATWIPWFIGVAVLEIVFTVVLYLRRRWTLAFAAVNAVLTAAFAVPAIWLLQGGRLLNPELLAALEPIAGGAWLGPTTAVTVIVIVVLSAWQVIEGFRNAARARA